jgi:hypothetical protein
MRSIISLVCLIACVLVAWLAMGSAPEAQAACRRYKVNVPLLHVRKDADAPGNYLGAMIQDEVACVAEGQTKGPNAFVLYKLLVDGREIPINGWANLSFMTPVESQVAPPVTTATSADTDGDTSLQDAQAPLAFEQPIPYGATQVRGRTIKQLAEGTPLFPPIDGLPESVWQKPCTSCHKWTRQALCDQGASYIPRSAEIFRHPHPYGGAYKLSLMRWAATGCK